MPNNKSICVLPFHHLDIRSSEKVNPCCFFDTTIVPDDFNLKYTDPFKHPFIESLREKMIKGEIVNGCERCYMSEESIGKSFRTEMLEIWEEKFRAKFEPSNPYLAYINLSISNLCNSKCRMCGPKYSTSWYSDARSLNIPIEKGSIKFDPITSGLDFSKIRTINLLGGEPLMEQERFIEILKKCDLNNLFIIITTNCTILPNESLSNLLSQCSSVKWNISIDGFERMNDFLRKGSRWSEVVENLQWFYNNYNNIEINTAVSLYNCNLVDQLSDFLLKNFPNVSHRQILISGPKWMEIKNLPLDAKIYVKNLIDSKDQLTDINKLILDELDREGNITEFVTMDQKLNRLRNESWKDLNPDLFHFIKDYYV